MPYIEKLWLLILLWSLPFNFAHRDSLCSDGGVSFATPIVITAVGWEWEVKNGKLIILYIPL